MCTDVVQLAALPSRYARHYLLFSNDVVAPAARIQCQPALNNEQAVLCTGEHAGVVL